MLFVRAEVNVETLRMKSSVRIANQTPTSVILDPEEGKYYSLTQVAAEICAALMTGASVPDLIQRVEAHFDTAGHDVAGEVTSFIDELRHLHLCETTS
jgi:hypothetical protein